MHSSVNSLASCSSGSLPVTAMVYLSPCFGNILEVTGISALKTPLIPAVVVSIKIDITPAFGTALANKSFYHRLPLKRQILVRFNPSVT